MHARREKKKKKRERNVPRFTDISSFNEMKPSGDNYPVCESHLIGFDAVTLWRLVNIDEAVQFKCPSCNNNHTMWLYDSVSEGRLKCNRFKNGSCKGNCGSKFPLTTALPPVANSVVAFLASNLDSAGGFDISDSDQAGLMFAKRVQTFISERFGVTLDQFRKLSPADRQIPKHLNSFGKCSTRKVQGQRIQVLRLSVS